VPTKLFGVGEDLRAAQEAGLVTSGLLRAYIFIMEVSPAVTKLISTKVEVGRLDPIFEGASYLDRAVIMCERIRDRGLYDLVWVAGVETNPTRLYEPNEAVGWNTFKSDLATKLPS
jgi:hypothetical protein